MDHQDMIVTPPGPLDTIAKLTAAINRGDLSAMVESFEPDAVLVVQPLAGQHGQTARGAAAIREAYAGFVSLKPALCRVSQTIVEAGSIALHSSRWTLTATSPDGKKIDRASVSSDVLRKQPDGRWLVVIYNPYGTSVVD